MIADVYNTTVNLDGRTMFSNSYTPFGCCCGGMYPMNSCFGYGFGGGFGDFGGMFGMTVGCAAGMALVPLMPQAFKAIGSGLNWLGKNVITPFANFAWNKVLKPVGNAVWSGIKWVGNTVAKGAKAVAKGVSNLWNKIFHKNSKSEKS